MSYTELAEMDEQIRIRTHPLNELRFYMDKGEVKTRVQTTIVSVSDNASVFIGALNLPPHFTKKALLHHPIALMEVLNARSVDASNHIYQWAMVEKKIVSYGPFKKHYISFTEVGDILLARGLEIDAEYDCESLYATITGTHPERGIVEVGEGDILRSGVTVTITPAMFSNPEILPFSFRMSCTNGMYLVHEKDRIHVIGHSRLMVIKEISLLVEKSFEEAEELNKSFAELAKDRVDVVSYAEIMVSEREVPKRFCGRILEGVRALPKNERTRYDVINIVTQLAEDQDDVRARRELRAKAGDQVVADTGGVRA